MYLLVFYPCYGEDGYRVLDLSDDRDASYYYEGQFHHHGDVVGQFASLEEAEAELQECLQYS